MISIKKRIFIITQNKRLTFYIHIYMHLFISVKIGCSILLCIDICLVRNIEWIFWMDILIFHHWIARCFSSTSSKSGVNKRIFKIIAERDMCMMLVIPPHFVIFHMKRAFVVAVVSVDVVVAVVVAVVVVIVACVFFLFFFLTLFLPFFFILLKLFVHLP